MTFLELPVDLADLAVELFVAGDAETLDQAAAIAADMQQVLAGCAEQWDADAGYLRMPEGDLLGPDGLRA